MNSIQVQLNELYKRREELIDEIRELEYEMEDIDEEITELECEIEHGEEKERENIEDSDDPNQLSF